jgi:hypothetical protein
LAGEAEAAGVTATEEAKADRIATRAGTEAFFMRKLFYRINASKSIRGTLLFLNRARISWLEE